MTLKAMVIPDTEWNARTCGNFRKAVCLEIDMGRPGSICADEYPMGQLTIYSYQTRN
jgi:hypothetical protein